MNLAFQSGLCSFGWEGSILPEPHAPVFRIGDDGARNGRNNISETKLSVSDLTMGCIADLALLMLSLALDARSAGVNFEQNLRPMLAL